MKLICAYVENFGKISCKKFDFNSGLTSIMQENGGGKSTLCAFIRSMFYGLASTTARSVHFLDREHYYPFNGGKFGGNITFEWKGKIYKIERFFAPRSDTGDEVSVYLNGSKTDELGENIGMTVFGLDVNSFTRTLFFPSDNTEGLDKSNVGINAKLNNFVDDTASGVNYDKATAVLSAKIKEYKLSRGSGGILNDIKEKQYAVNNEIEALKKINSALNGKYEERKAKLLRCQELEKEEKIALQKEKAVIYKRYLQQLQVKQEALNGLKRDYPLGIPDREETTALESLLDKAKENKTRAIGAEMQSDKAFRLQSLGSRFGGKDVEGDLKNLDGILKEKERLQNELSLNGDSSLSSPPKAKGKVNFGKIKTDRLLSIKDKMSALKEDERILSDGLSNGKNSQNKRKSTYWLAFVFSLLLIGGGVFAFLKELESLIYLTAFGLGGLFMIIFIVMAIKKNAGKKVDIDNLNRVNGEIKRLNGELKEELFSLGYNESTVEMAYMSLMKDYEYYKDYSESGRRLEERRKNLAERISDCENKEREIFSKYKSSDGNPDRLKRDYYEYQRLAEEYNKSQKDQLDFRRNTGAYIEKINGILSKYGMRAEEDLVGQIRKIRSDNLTKENLSADISSLQAEADKYKSENNIDLSMDKNARDIDSIRNELTGLRRAIGQLMAEIGQDENTVEALSGKREELGELAEKYEEANYKYGVLKNALSCLEKAEVTLQEKHIAPTKNKFIEYFNEIEKDIGENISMDKDFCVYYEQNGATHQEKYLSTGQKAVADLCLRLALIDNMYDGEKPFIILDDPFSNLDKERFSGVAKAVLGLAEKEQIIYLTCHESRKIQ